MIRWLEDETPNSALVRWLALFVLAGHIAVNIFTVYGFHRDELLYIAMGEHLRFWRMDFPPFIALTARVTRAILGSSLTAIRFVPAVAAALLVLLAGKAARRMGGGAFAQGAAAVAVAACPLFMRAGNLFQPVILDQLWWTLALYCLIRLGTDEKPRRGEQPAWWIRLGIVAGFGLLTKFSILFFGAAVLGAIIISPRRRALLTRWPWVTLLLALAIGSPSLVGQIRLGWPVLGQLHALQSVQLERVTRGAYLIGQLFYGPAALMALLGAAWLIVAEKARPFRLAGWSAVLAFVLLFVLHGKPYYIGPIYPVLFAAGAVALEQVRSRRGRLLRTVAVALIVIYGIVFLPVGVPIVPPARMVRYAAAMTPKRTLTTNTGTALSLPQDYADMLGWDSLAAVTARVYRALPDSIRSQTVLLAANYGEAGALDLLGRPLGLPPVVSSAGSYWFFGPGKLPARIALAVGITAAQLKPFFGRLTPVGEVLNPLGVPEEQRVELFLCEEPVRTIQEVWPSLAGQN
jgi:dolichyl-phosphate-mannose-protein mannosyltransferase